MRKTDKTDRQTEKHRQIPGQCFTLTVINVPEAIPKHNDI